MCSTVDTRLALIGEAIDDVARALAGETGATAVGELTIRLASIWVMVADLDPALAASLPGYIRDTGHPSEPSAFTVGNPKTAVHVEAGG